MRKKLLFLNFGLLLFLTIPCIGQQEVIKLRTLETYDRVFKGTIDNKYPVTIYLKFFRNADNFKYVYSVKGWYYYNEYRKKINITGLYLPGKLHLYHFKNPDLDNFILNIGEDNGLTYRDIDSCCNLKGYNEKLVLLSDYDRVQGKWVNGEKELSIQVDSHDLVIVQKKEFLEFGDGLQFDLSTLGDWFWNFKMVTSKNNSRRVILSYKYLLAGKRNGMCGVGFDEGFISLHFSESYDLVSVTDCHIWSCLENIDLEEEQEIKPGVIRYKTFRHDSQKHVSFDINYNIAKINYVLDSGE
jgi:hypothetical protein